MLYKKCKWVGSYTQDISVMFRLILEKFFHSLLTATLHCSLFFMEECLKEKLAELNKAELIVFKNGRITLTPHGYLVCDEISLQIISALEKKAGVEWKQESEANENDILLQETAKAFKTA